MATGFGYVRDSKPMQIDWQDIGKQMSDNIGLEMADRQKRKDDIDQKIGDYKKALLDQPQGSNAETNRFFADFTSDAGDAMRNAERLLKSSQLSERDFYKFRANANQGTDLMFTAGKKFNEGHDEAMRRFGAGESQAKENWMRQQTEGFLNFSKNGAYINPLTGEVNVARRYKDARGDWQISTTPGDFANASELVQQATAQYNSFDLDAAVTKAVNGLGATLIQQSDGRSTKQFFQAMQEGKLGEDEQKLLNDAKKNMVASFTVDPNHISSILTGNIGVAPNGSAYDFTYDETEANNNPHLILVNPDGTNNFKSKNGKAQKEAVEKYANARFAASLGGERREKQTPVVKPASDTAIKTQKLRNKEIGYLKSIDNVISGDATTAQASIDAMIQGANVIYGKSPGIQNIKNAERSEDGNTLTVTRVNADGDISEAIPYDISDPNKAGEVMVELFFPNVKGSYEELLTDYNKQGGFTQREIKNPNYKVDEKGLPTDPNEKQFIPNPNYKGASEVGKTKGKVTIKEDFDTAEFLGEKAGDEKPLKKVIDDVDLGTYVFSGDANLSRSKAMSEGAVKAFEVLKFDLPDLIVKTRATANGLELTIPSLFDGILTLTNEYTSGGKTKQNYVDAIKQIFNSIAKGTPFDKSEFEKK